MDFYTALGLVTLFVGVCIVFFEVNRIKRRDSVQSWNKTFVFSVLTAAWSFSTVILATLVMSIGDPMGWGTLLYYSIMSVAVPITTFVIAFLAGYPRKIPKEPLTLTVYDKLLMVFLTLTPFLFFGYVYFS